MNLNQIIYKKSSYVTFKKAINNYLKINFNLMVINFGNIKIIY
jgi:hypothetical protein